MTSSEYSPETYPEYAEKNDQYAGLLKGETDAAAHWTVLDPAYADLFCRNLIGHLRLLNLPETGGVVDMGCGGGHITAGLHRLLGRPAAGIDASPAVIEYATKTHSGPEFYCRSADDFSGLEDGSLALVMAREFYPFSRERDTDLHMRFLEPGFAKLAAGGLFAVVQVRDPSAQAGVHQNWAELRRRARAAGYAESGVMVMAPQFLFRRLGAVLFNPPARAAVTLAGRALEALRPGKVTYIYWLRKRG